MPESRIRWISSGMVPGLDAVSENWSCLDGLLELYELEAERKELRRALGAIPRVPMTRAEVRAAHLESLETAVVRYAETKLAKFISENLTVTNPFKRLERMSFFSVAFPSKEQVERAIAALPDEAFGTADQKEKSRETAKIRKRLTAIDQRLAEISCPPFLKLDPDGVLSDVRIRFHQHWLSLQSRCAAPCDPQGIELRGAAPEILAAYEKLEIRKAVAKETAHADLPATRV